jgi:hypothetical protein
MSSFGGRGNGGGSLKSLKKKQYNSNSSPIQNGEIVDITLDKVKTQLDDHNTRINAIIDPSNPLNSYRGVFPTLANLQSSVTNPGALDWALVSGTKTLYVWDTLGQWSSYAVSQEVQELINNAINNLKNGVPVEGDTLNKLYNLISNTYTKTQTDNLLISKQNIIYDLSTTESIIFGITDIAQAGKIAFATDTKKIYKSFNINGTLVWSLYYGFESQFSYTLNANEIKTISLLPPSDFKSTYNVTIKASSGEITNTLAMEFFHKLNNNSGLITDVSLFTDDNDIALIQIYDSSTSIQANKIAMQLQNLFNNSVNIFIYIN